jgi:hypothetical protein
MRPALTGIREGISQQLLVPSSTLALAYSFNLQFQADSYLGSWTMANTLSAGPTDYVTPYMNGGGGCSINDVPVACVNGAQSLELRADRWRGRSLELRFLLSQTSGPPVFVTIDDVSLVATVCE